MECIKLVYICFYFWGKKICDVLLRCASLLAVQKSRRGWFISFVIRMTDKTFALNLYMRMYFGKNNLAYLYTQRWITNSEPSHRRDSNVHVDTRSGCLAWDRSWEQHSKLSTISKIDILTETSLQTHYLCPSEFASQRKKVLLPDSMLKLQLSICMLENSFCKA